MSAHRAHTALARRRTDGKQITIFITTGTARKRAAIIPHNRSATLRSATHVAAPYVLLRRRRVVKLLYLVLIAPPTRTRDELVFRSQNRPGSFIGKIRWYAVTRSPVVRSSATPLAPRPYSSSNRPDPFADLRTAVR